MTRADDGRGQHAPGDTYWLRFAVASNVGTINMGVDNVSLVATPIPEPGSIVLLGTIAAAIAIGLKRKRMPV